MTRMVQRRASSTDWAAENPVLDAGEPGYETDTHKLKMGDGVLSWLALKLPYIQTSVVKALGDIITIIPGDQLLVNSTMDIDTNSDGIVDGWAVYGDPSTLTVENGGQRINPASGQQTLIQQDIHVIMDKLYRFTIVFSSQDMVGGKLGFRVDWFEDYQGSGFLSYEYQEDTRSFTADTYTNVWTAPFAAVMARVSIYVQSGDSTILSASFADATIIDPSGTKVGVIPRGQTNQTLGVLQDGSLGWVDVAAVYTGGAPGYMLESTMQSTYETKANSDTVHAGLETTAHAAATYETQSAANVTHGLLQQAAYAASDGITPVQLAAGYELANFQKVKTTTTTITNFQDVSGDADLVFPVVAFGVYTYEIFLNLLGDYQNNAALSIYGPKGIRTVFGAHTPPNTKPAGTNLHTTLHSPVGGGYGSNAYPVPCGLESATIPTFAVVKGIVFVGANSGNVGLSFAQNVAASGKSVTLGAGSWIRSQKIGTGSAPASILPFADNFNRGGGPIVNEWVQRIPSAYISSNQGIIASPNAMYTRNVEATDVQATATFLRGSDTGTTGGYVIVRGVGSLFNFKFAWRSDGYQAYTTLNGVIANVFSQASPVPASGQSFTVSVKVIGNQAQCYRDGTLITTVTLPSTLLTGTDVGWQGASSLATPDKITNFTCVVAP